MKDYQKDYFTSSNEKLMSNHNEISSFIWNVCDDVLRGLFKQHEYGDVILPFVVLRRLDCVLEGKKDEIIKVHKEYRDKFDDTSKIIHSKHNLKFSFKVHVVYITQTFIFRNRV